MPLELTYLGYLLLLGGASALTLLRSWPRILIALAVQSLGLGLLAAQISYAPIAIAKTIVGWIAVSLLAVTLSRERRETRMEESSAVSVFFRFSLLLFLFSSIVALLPQLGGVFGEPPAGIAFCVCFLIGVGLINLGLSEHPLRTAVNLLTLLQGFELGYLWIEQSLLVLALLAATDLAIILVLIILNSYSALMVPSESSV